MADDDEEMLTCSLCGAEVPWAYLGVNDALICAECLRAAQDGAGDITDAR